MRSTKRGRVAAAAAGPGQDRAGRRRRRTLAAIGAAGIAALSTAGPASAFDVGSATLTWNVPYTTSSAGGSYSLAGYATSIGVIGGATGNVVVSGAGTTGGPITSSSTPAPGTGVSYPFTFPGAGTIGTYDAATGGTLAFAGTLTFTAHSSTFLKVIDPKIAFDAAGGNIVSIRVTAGGGGEVSPAQDAPAGTPNTVLSNGQTVFAVNPTASTTNPDGSITYTGLAGAAATGGLSSNAAFNSIRDFFANRALNTFAITLKEAEDTTPPPDDPPPTEPPSESDTSKNLDVSGTVSDALGLTLADSSIDLGPFLPGVADDYEGTIAAQVTSTGPATLSVVDADTGPTAGRLVNGTAALANALQANANAGTYATVAGTPATLLTFPSAVSAQPVTIGLKQTIGATEGLTAGTYGKTLTFTVSAGA